MSSGQNKKVSSITRKLCREMRRKRMRAFRLSNLIMFIAIFVAIPLAAEYTYFGSLNAGNSRFIDADSYAVNEFEDSIKSYVNANTNEDIRPRWVGTLVRGATAGVYAIEHWESLDGVITYISRGTQQNAENVFKFPMFVKLSYGVLVLILLTVCERILCLLLSFSDKFKVKRILKPINEMALKADELTRLQFDETKYHNLEEKLALLKPEESLDVTEGDKELQSLENAINNLLLRMRESNMQQARFVNDASHELRTPIAVIEGYANMLARWGREDEKVLDESIAAIRNESSHMKYLVEQLLFLARGDSGKTVLKLDDVSLTDMMREIYEESLMIDEEHVYRFNCSEEDVRLTCDPSLMKQAVRILVDNAAKYTAPKDEIYISVGVNDSGRPYLQVEDTGIGMAESDIVHMFERFYRSDEARSFKGTGLGLSIAKWIVDKHKGCFEVISREDIGTRIRIVLGA